MEPIKLELLELLTKDARITVSQIAVLLGVSEAAVTKMIDELTQSGVIMGYSAVLNLEKLEGDKVNALIEVKVTPQRNLGFDAIAEEIYSFDEVRACYLMSGAYDLMVIVEGNTIKQVSRFVSEKLSLLDNVQSCSTHFILKRYKDNGHTFVQRDGDSRLVVSP